MPDAFPGGRPGRALTAVPGGSEETVSMTQGRSIVVVALIMTLLVGGLSAPPSATAGADGQVTWAVHITLAPTWFDPAETAGIITPYMVLYALHDALVKPMPGKPMAPSLAESWTQSKDGLVYEFVNYLQQIGIRLRLRPMERAAFFKEYGEKKLRGVIFSGSGAPGNAPTRLEQYVVTGGRYTYGSYPDLDGLYTEQVNEMNPRVRQQILFKMQQLIHEKALFGPVIEPAFLNGVGPRLEVSGLGLITNHAYSAPYEDVRLKRP